jgi:hypothetical protein
MKKFVALYLGTEQARSAWDKLSESERKQREAAGMKAWGEWMVTHQKSVIDNGGPLGKTRRIDPQGVADTNNAVAGYIVVQAESHEAAAKLFLNHPHFSIFPGDSVEIMEVLPIPGSR